MAFQLGEDHDSGINEMNLIPLIDIMLVLMIIFLVTATVANPSIPLTLPKTTAEIIDPPPKAITISINANGEVAWDTQVISLDELQNVSKKQVKVRLNQPFNFVLIKSRSTIR